MASAFVQVDPDADTFEDQLEAQLGAVKFVVTIPVVPDAGDLPGEVDAAVAESKATVTVPVVPDTEGFQLLIDNAVAEAKATVTVPVVPDVAGLPEAIDEAVAAADKPVTVPVVPDTEGFDALPEAMAGIGNEAGGVFSARFMAMIEGVIPEAIPGMIQGALPAMGAAGEAAGTAYGESFTAAERAFLASYTASIGSESVAGAASAGGEAGAAYSGRMLSVIEGTIPERIPGMIEGSVPAATAAGEEAGAGFASRFSAALAGVGARMDGLFAGAGAEGAAAGAEAGEGFTSGLKGVLTGGSLMEILIPSALVAGVAVLASNFQSAMERIHTQAGVAQSAIAGLSNGVLTLAGQVGFSPDSLALAVYHVESSFSGMKLSGKEALDIVKTAAEGARIGNANLTDTMDALDGTIVSGITHGQSYTQVMGELNGVVGAGDMTMQNLNETMTSGLMANANLYGQSLPQVGAALDTLGDNLIRGAKAGTDLRMAWQAMLDPLTTAGPMLAHIGLKAGQLGYTLTHAGLSQAIDLFVDHLKSSKVPISDWGTYVTDIFGKKAGAGIGVLVKNYARLNEKFKDISKNSHTFAADWAATQATTSQKLHELEGSFEALGVKIGTKLLPYINQFMGYIIKALPKLEKFGGSIARIVAPLVITFFKGLGGIVKELVDFMKGNEGNIEKFAKQLAKLALPVVRTFFANLLAVVKLLVGDIEGWLPKFEKLGEFVAKLAAPAVGLFFTGLGGILKVLLGPLKDVTLAVGIAVGVWTALNVVLAINPFVAVGIALVILVGLIIKYHKQIWNVIKDAWDHILNFLKGWFPLLLGIFAGPFGAIVGLIIKYHKQIWDFIKHTWDDVFKFLKGLWKDVVDFAKDNWLEILLGPAGLIVKYHEDIWKFIQRIWNDVYDFFSRIIGDIIRFFKSSWDTIWGDIKSVWNNIHQWLVTWWDNEVSGWKHIVTTVEGWLRTAWDTIKDDAVKGFDDVRHSIAHIWDEIVQDIEHFIKEIESKISGIGKTVVSLPGKLLGDIGLAGGGVLPGYAPGHDSISAKLSPGEAVLVPEAVKAIGAPAINATNAHYSSGRSGGKGYSAGGIAGFADGGVAGPAPYGAPVSAMASQVAGSAIAGQGPAGTATGITVNFYGTQLPSPEQMQAISLELTRAVAMA